MNKPTVLTYIYAPFENAVCSTFEFLRSCRAFDYEVVNAWQGKRHEGHAMTFKALEAALQDINGPVVYADGADSFFLREINVPTDRILYSTEKAYWEPIGGEERYTDKQTPWCYLNGGGWCGPAELVREFYKRYDLGNLKTANAQMHQHDAYFAALADGFPIELDQFCTEFQTIAFDEDFQKHGWSDHFSIETKHAIGSLNREIFIEANLYNEYTKTYPALIHGNGQTPMHHIYKLLK